MRNAVKAIPEEVTLVEEFDLRLKDKQVSAAAKFRTDSLFAAWIYRLAVLLFLGWNGQSLNSLGDRIADRVAEKIAITITQKGTPATVERSEDPPPPQPKTSRRRRPRTPAPTIPTKPGPFVNYLRQEIVTDDTRLAHNVLPPWDKEIER